MTKGRARIYEPGSREKWEAVRNPAAEDGLQGIGTSEIAMATGHCTFKDPLTLWQEKVGLKEPFRGNEDTERGRKGEPVSRARFAMENRDWCRVEYHETRYYISEDLPLFSTLDGEIIVTEAHELTCIDAKTGRLVAMRLSKGMRGILEIKDAMPRNAEGYGEWNAVPVMYQYQNAGQLRVTGFDFVLDYAHITGEFAEGGEEYRLYGAFADEFDAEAEEIEAVVPVFWGYVRDRRQPPLAIFDDKSMSLVEIQPDIQIGSIWADLDRAKVQVERYARQFDGITFGEDELKEAKKVRAELNRYKKSLNDMRIAVGKQWDAPLVAFKARVDELIGIVDRVCVPVDEHIKDAETALDEAKRKRVMDAIDEAISACENPAAVDAIKAMGGIPFNEKWLNATKRLPAIRTEISDYIAMVSSDIASIAMVADDEQMHQSLLQEYYRSRNLNEALMAKERIIAARRAAEAAEAKGRERLGALKKSVDAWNAEQRRGDETPDAPWQETPVTEPERTAEEADKRPEIGITIRFYHRDPEAFKALLAYMTEHGFTYEMA